MRVEPLLNNQYRNETINNQDETPKKGGLSSIFSSQKGEVNGKIDEDFSQGNIGDCALLSSVYSLSLSEEGAEAIKNAIKINEDGSYDVYFAGVDETYNVTQEEIDKAKEYHGNSDNKRVYSRGDDDMTLIELAAEKCFNKSEDKELRQLVDNYTDLNIEDKLNGVNPASISYLFTGKEVDTVTKHDTNLKKRFIPCSTYNIEDKNGEEVCLKEGNQYTAKGITKDNLYIYIENPFDDSEMVIPVNNFLADVYLPDINEAAEKSNKFLEDFEENKDNSMLVFATMGMETVKDVNGKNVELFGPHAFSVADVEDDIVTLVNPHDTSEEVKIPQENLLALERYYFYGIDFDEDKSNL